MDDDQLESAWLSFARALRENERAKIKRQWLFLAPRKTLLSDLSHSGASMNARQMQAMMGTPHQQHGQIRGIASGPLSFLGL